jgi:hypothetical protein
MTTWRLASRPRAGRNIENASKLNPQTSLHRWRSQQRIGEFVEQVLGEPQVVANVAGSRNENGQYCERRLRAQGGEFEQQTAFADAPVAQNGE